MPAFFAVTRSSCRSVFWVIFIDSLSLLSRFDGKGYDKELVDMLERDVLSLSPNVQWSDIAGKSR